MPNEGRTSQVVDTTRVIAPVVVDRPKPPIYTLLLGKHWIRNIGLIGYYNGISTLSGLMTFAESRS